MAKRVAATLANSMHKNIKTSSPLSGEISSLRNLANSFRKQLQELEALEEEWELRRKSLWDVYFSSRIGRHFALQFSPEEHDRRARQAFVELVAMGCPDALRYLKRGRPQGEDTAVESPELADRTKLSTAFLPS